MSDMAGIAPETPDLPENFDSNDWTLTHKIMKAFLGTCVTTIQKRHAEWSLVLVRALATGKTPENCPEVRALFAINNSTRATLQRMKYLQIRIQDMTDISPHFQEIRTEITAIMDGVEIGIELAQNILLPRQ
jgi:hypothetical protein